MTKASGTASRAAAERRADDLLARRAAQFREREKELHRLVTDYHHAAAQAAKIHADAQERSMKITTEAQARIAALCERADKEASVFKDAANTAVRSILQFGESRRAVMSLTGLTAAQVRAIEHAERSATTARRPAEHGTPPAQTTP